MTKSPALAQLACFSIYAAGLAFNRLYKQLLEPFGLTYPQYLVLLLLAYEDDQTVGALGEALYLESNTLTPLLKRLEAAGLVARRRDSADERVVRITLTDQGRALTAALACVPPDVLAASGLTAQDLTALARQVDALAASVRSAR